MSEQTRFLVFTAVVGGLAYYLLKGKGVAPAMTAAQQTAVNLANAVDNGDTIDGPPLPNGQLFDPGAAAGN